MSEHASEMSAEDADATAFMCAIEALALRPVAFYLNACQNIKSLSPGNAATSRSSIRNIHAITLGNLMAATRCRRRPRPLISAIQNLVDPEEAFVASLSSCHMLTFLAVACKKKFVLDEYVDDAVGHMEKNAEGRLAITRVDSHRKLEVFRRETTDRAGDRRDASCRARAMFHRQLGEDRR